MAKLLANENVASDVVLSLRSTGHDIVWIRDILPGTSDENVLALAVTENRILLTFDKDFGELAFRRGQHATPGVILLRPRIKSPDYLVRFAQAVLIQNHHWEGHFTVAEEGRLRIVPLP